MATKIIAEATVPESMAIMLKRAMEAVDDEAIVVLEPVLPLAVAEPIVEGETDPV